jgi:hypothetical protein
VKVLPDPLLPLPPGFPRNDGGRQPVMQNKFSAFLHQEEGVFLIIYSL